MYDWQIEKAPYTNIVHIMKTAKAPGTELFMAVGNRHIKIAAAQ
jgi:hypothetical protein